MNTDTAQPTVSSIKSSIETIYPIDAALRAAACKAHQADGLSTDEHREINFASGRAFQALAAEHGWNWIELGDALWAHAVKLAKARAYA